MGTVITVVESEFKSGTFNKVATSFDGVDDNGVITNDDEIKIGTEDFSFLVRFTQKVLAGGKIFLSMDAGSGKFWRFGINTGKLEFFYDDGDGNTFQNTSGVSITDLDKYITMIVSADRSGNLVIYVDGVLDTTTDFSSFSANDMNIDGITLIGQLQALFHEGLIDQLILWRGFAIVPAEITALFNNGFTIDPRKADIYAGTVSQKTMKAINTKAGGFLALYLEMGDDDNFPFVRDHANEGHAKLDNSMTVADFVTTTSP